MPARKSQPIDPWSMMDLIVARETEPSGKEWFTVNDFMARYPGKFTIQRCAARYLKEMYERDILEQWKGHVKGHNAITCKYRFKKKEAA